MHPEESPPAAHYTQRRFKAPPIGEAAFNVYIQNMFKYTRSPIFNTFFKILADRQQYIFISKKKIKKYFKKGYILNFEAGNKVSILSVSVDEFAIRSIFGSIRLSVVGSVITTVAAVSSFAFCKCITLNSTMYFKINRKLLCR